MEEAPKMEDHMDIISNLIHKCTREGAPKKYDAVRKSLVE
jgi:hypothetical protein